ncbi:MAG TPA: CocE/NonD family hydrolase, partial [Mycobacteriales bacterium]|nr:CocE/NonD family hydrolase [Mycobacteriales bacterium]
MRRVLSLALTAVALAVAAHAAPGTPAGEEFTAATPPQTAALPDLDRIDPVRFAYDDAIIEHYQVPTRKNPPTCMPAVSLATCPDLVWVDVIRPNTEAVKVPTIMMSSPYFNTNGRGFKGERKTPHSTTPNPPDEPLTGFPEWYDEYFVPRGYAFAAMDLRGSRNSSGCQTYGDRDEVTDAVDVIDFLAEQPWSSGKFGMTGGSYDGTIANGAAVEAPLSAKHPDALSAIIPIRAIGAWYDYHFFNGVQSSSHLLTPGSFTVLGPPTDTPNSGTDDVLYPLHVAERIACVGTFGAIAAAGYASPYQDASSAFWAERDFVKDAGGVRAATFVIHGLFDFNVKPHNAGYLWHALPAGLPKKLWLVNGDHYDPRCPDEETCNASGHLVPYPVADRYIEANHRWWLQFLKGVEAGALRTPVEVQRRDGKLEPSAAYPAPGKRLPLTLTADGRAVPPGTSAGDEGAVSYADGPLGQGSPASVQFVTAPFPKATRLSGQLDLALPVTTTGPDTTIAVQVDDLPASAADDASGGTSRYDVREPDEVVTFTYAWLRASYRDSVHPGPERSIPT